MRSIILRGLLAALVAHSSLSQAQDDVFFGTDLFPLFSMGPWEASTPQANEMKDQGAFPYCGLYAMSTFLEVWGNGNKGFRVPSLDVPHLALAYNRVVGSPGRGVHPFWLAMTIQVFGTIPKGAQSVSSKAWPLQDWENAQSQLIDTKISDPILAGEFSYGTSRFNGPRFLNDVVRIDLRNFFSLYSNWQEDYVPDEPVVNGRARTQTQEPPLRLGTLGATAQNMNALAAKMGADPRQGMVDPSDLYRAVKAQLYTGRPVLLTINASLTQDAFRRYGVIVGSHLTPVGQSKMGPHGVVAVAHCDKSNSVDRICQRFNRYLTRTQEGECIAIQNSWGLDVHERGYFCVAPTAWSRVAMGALIDKRLLKTTP